MRKLTEHTGIVNSVDVAKGDPNVIASASDDCTGIHTYIHTYSHTYIHTYILPCMYKYPLHIFGKHTYMYIILFLNVLNPKKILSCMYVCIYVYMYVCMDSDSVGCPQQKVCL